MNKDSQKKQGYCSYKTLLDIRTLTHFNLALQYGHGCVVTWISYFPGDRAQATVPEKATW